MRLSKSSPLSSLDGHVVVALEPVRWELHQFEALLVRMLHDVVRRAARQSSRPSYDDREERIDWRHDSDALRVVYSQGVLNALRKVDHRVIVSLLVSADVCDEPVAPITQVAAWAVDRVVPAMAIRYSRLKQFHISLLAH